MTKPSRLQAARWMVLAGGILIIIGAVDPLEGSLLILPGAGMTASGLWLGAAERSVILFHWMVFCLIAVGIGALWALRFAGGFGGESGRTNAWGLLVMPYVIGLPLALVGSGLPPWHYRAGLMVGVWYVLLGIMLLRRAGDHWQLPIGIAFVGSMIVGGCLWRLIHRLKSP